MLRNLYPSHRPTSLIQKVILASQSAVTALIDPTRDDAVRFCFRRMTNTTLSQNIQFQIAVLGETTGYLALKGMYSRMKRDVKGREILEERPTISMDSIDFERLRSDCQPGSLGSSYVSFMDSHEFNPDERKSVMYVDDEELAYVMQRYRELHDFWHVLLGLPPSVRGELALKWFELVQTGLPMTAISAVVGPSRLSSSESTSFWSVDVPWAIRSGQRAEFLMNVNVENLLNEPLDQLRKSLNIEVHPEVDR